MAIISKDIWIVNGIGNYFLLDKAIYTLLIFTVSLKRLYLHLKKMILYTIKP